MITRRELFGVIAAAALAPLAIEHASKVSPPNVEALDDFEVGTFIPKLATSEDEIAYALTPMRYMKVGKVVTVSGVLMFSRFGSTPVARSVAYEQRLDEFERSRVWWHSTPFEAIPAKARNEAGVLLSRQAKIGRAHV